MVCVTGDAQWNHERGTRTVKDPVVDVLCFSHVATYIFIAAGRYLAYNFDAGSPELVACFNEPDFRQR